MKRLLALVMFLMFPVAAAFASTEYVLVPDESDVLVLDKSMTIGKPLVDITATGGNGKCGYYYNSSTFAYAVDSQYSGTLYGVHVLSSDSSGAKGARIFTQAFNVGEDVGPAKRFSAWTEVAKSSGQICTETLPNGTSVTFKKYSVTCDDCTP